MEEKDFVTPKCCKENDEHAALFLSLDIYEGEKKPKWVVRVYDKKYHCDNVIEAKFCPFCSKPVTKIVPSRIKEKIMKVTDGGYYCDTCKDRISNCQCLPPEFAWKAK